MTSTTFCEWLAQHITNDPALSTLPRGSSAGSGVMPSEPDCPACVRIDVCAKQVDRAADVRGV
jgi:hypothetical protein